MSRVSSEKILQKLFADSGRQMAEQYDNLFTEILKRYRSVQPQVHQLNARLIDELPYKELAKFAERIVKGEDRPFFDLPEFENEMQKIARTMRDDVANPAANRPISHGLKKSEADRFASEEVHESESVHKIAINHPLMQGVIRDFATQVGYSRADEHIRVAFRKAGLDQNNPLHWRVLIWMFAQAHFGPRSPTSTFWTVEKYCQLIRDVAQVKAGNSHIGDRAACKNIAGNSRYKSGATALSWERLRKALREARSPEFNGLLAAAVMARLQKRKSESAVRWTPEFEKEQEKEIIKGVLKQISECWPDRRLWAL